MMKVLRCTLAVLLLSSAAAAEDLGEKLALGLYEGAAVPMGSRWLRENSDVGLGLGGWLRYHLDRRWGAELSYQTERFDSDARSRVNPTLASVLYQLAPRSKWNPNVHAGLGWAEVRNIPDGSLSAFALKVGAGADVFACPHFSIGAAVDYVYARRGEAHLLLAGLNLGFWPFRVEEEKPVARKPLDSDRDGVFDDIDRCPDTPVGNAVDEKGCLLDGDKDAVPDLRDQCAGTPAGTPVNSMGCPKEQTVAIQLEIVFDTAKWDIRPEYDSQLRKVSEFLKLYPDVVVEIEGHTDNVGDEAANVTLSQQRADSVREALVSRFGADGARLSAKGYGPSKPVDTNDTPEGRQKNRRVVATFTAK